MKVVCIDDIPRDLTNGQLNAWGSGRCPSWPLKKDSVFCVRRVVTIKGVTGYELVGFSGFTFEAKRFRRLEEVKQEASEKGAVITARDYKHLPAELGEAENNTDTQTDYFDNDRIRYNEGTPEYAAVLKMIEANNAKFADLEKARQAKRAERAGKTQQVFTVTRQNRKGEQRTIAKSIGDLTKS